VIEGEAAYLAALRRDDELLARLEEAVAVHEEAARTGELGFRTVGMDLHVLVGRSAASPIFEALIESLTSPTVERVESTLDLITSSRGTLGDSAAEHRRLVEAIRAQDGDAARDLMQRHLARLEHEVAQYTAETDGSALLTALSALRTFDTGTPRY
jgi:GntR family transcriptional repressor for pyruvate dehydrogenase complex